MQLTIWPCLPQEFFPDFYQPRSGMVLEWWGRRRLGHLVPALFLCRATQKSLKMFRFSENCQIFKKLGKCQIFRKFNRFSDFGKFSDFRFWLFSFSSLFYLRSKNTLVAAGSCKTWFYLLNQR